MALTEGQWQVRDLVLGPGTPYRVLADANPFVREARADQAGPRAWNHGSYSGAEWLDQVVVGMRVFVQAADRSQITWLGLLQQLTAAFDPVGDTPTEVELRFFTGDEYVMFGRPRMVEPDTTLSGTGQSYVQCVFVALDPRIYSGDQQTQILGLPTFEGGLTVPLQAPFTVDGVLVDGSADITNSGLAATPLGLRIDGPVPFPRVTVQPPTGEAQALQVLFDIGAGQWLDIDTGSHSVLLNGVANRRGQVTGVFPILPPGTSTLRFDAASFNDTAKLTATWRHAW